MQTPLRAALPSQLVCSAFYLVPAHRRCVKLRCPSLQGCHLHAASSVLPLGQKEAGKHRVAYCSCSFWPWSFSKGLRSSLYCCINIFNRSFIHFENGLLSARVNDWYFLAIFGLDKLVVDEQLQRKVLEACSKQKHGSEQELPNVLAWV